MVTEPVLLNATQAAAYLGVSRKTFWELRKRDKSFPAGHCISTLRKQWRRKELDEWIDRGARKDAEA